MWAFTLSAVLVLKCYAWSLRQASSLMYALPLVTCWDGVAGYQHGVAAVTAASEVRQAAAGHSAEDSTVLLDSDSEVRYPPFTSRPVCVCVCASGGGGGGGVSFANARCNTMCLLYQDIRPCPKMYLVTPIVELHFSVSPWPLDKIAASC